MTPNNEALCAAGFLHLGKAKEIVGAVPKERLVRASEVEGYRWGHGEEVLQRLPEHSRVAPGLSKNIGECGMETEGYAPILLNTNASRLSSTSHPLLDQLAAGGPGRVARREHKQHNVGLVGDRSRKGSTPDHTSISVQLADLATNPFCPVSAVRPTARRRIPNSIRDIPSDVSGRASVASGKMKGHCICTLRKVADQTDAMLLVLDAHDTTGAAASLSRCRCEEDKRLVFVFNMIDPVPRENAQAFAEGPPPRDPNDAWIRTNFSFGISPAISFTFWRQLDQTLLSAQGGLPSFSIPVWWLIVQTRVKVRFVTSRPAGRTKELPSVHLEHVHRMVDSPGTSFQ
ncbi:hypothetical protein EDB89DRAFT_2072615 [Lactarius sanguifluus]|nr:hypothetical protein EDB89DRAFT_2072615 [Lactarius sanguifluus]